MPIKITHVAWGKVANQEARLFTLENGQGSYVQLTNFGAGIVSIVVPDKHGVLGNVVLGFDDFEGYYHDVLYVGSTIGRYANRIAEATFSLRSSVFHLEKNDNEHSNHGGCSGFHKQWFDYSSDGDAVSFKLFSPDGEGGYPGNLVITVDYRWNDDDELTISYHATADRATILNITNHTYFNLSACDEDIFDHRLHIRSHQLLETTPEHIPTGKIVPADELVFAGQAVGGRVASINGKCSGINSYYLLDGIGEEKQSAACLLYEETSGRQLSVFTSYPGVLLYTGDYLYVQRVGKQAGKHIPFGGLCLECQYFPDSPNHSHFPSTVLEAGENYQETIRYRFEVLPDKKQR